MPLRHSVLGGQSLLWLKNGKEKWEFLQAAKQQAITTSQVTGIQVGQAGRTGSCQWGLQNNNRFHYEDQLLVGLLQQGQPLGCGGWGGG